ncbi:hypothetical protein [Caballeronia sp. LZ035]|uniref:hypothetical protein n=1 Tax=Caballeronia sp. LZ035 TaxID=3038568 RepID=UPI002859E4DB|nr:hypothetical protein [Caballeronia sp. LZ035]MDR5758200.1 hypothetical protein [Caballeronia sp. LZ035]
MATQRLLYKNNPIGTLSAPITNTSPTVTLGAGAALFPAVGAGQSFYATLSDTATGSQIEIVLVTAVSGNIFSITRGQDGTTALSFNAGDQISQRTVAAELNAFQNAAEGNFILNNVQITPSSTLGVAGTILADDAQPGAVGEYVTFSSAGIVTPTNVVRNAAAFVIQAGDWDVTATTAVFGTGTINLLNLQTGISLISQTFQNFGNNAIQANQILLASGQIQVPCSIVAPSRRINVAIPTTVYLVAQAGYTGGGTLSSIGTINFRRMR